MFKSGFVTIIGRPNVGKSTLLNNILKQKVAIMSNKPQTTRNKIQGIYTTDKEQIVFMDTPGIHKPRHELGKQMTDVALSTTKGVDAILFVVDVTMELGKGDQFIIDQLSNSKTPIILLINKIDKINKNELLPSIESYKDKLNFKHILPISALESTNVDKLIDLLTEELEEGPMYFPKDQIVDYPERFIISEIIREKILHLTRDEVPHSIAVIIDSIEQDENNSNLLNCNATIYVERTSQKSIIIGKQGNLIKEVGSRARKEIKNILGSKVYLELWVKVKKDWRNRRTDLNNFVYND